MPAPFIGAVEQLFAMTSGDAADLANRLFSSSRRAYEATVNQQLRALGREPDFRLTNSAELSRLKREAIATARGIADTYNRELTARVDQVVEAEGARGLNRRTLARRLADWDAERAVWKAEQVRTTEAARVAHDAVREFARASGLDTVARYVLLPATSDHDDPNDQAARAGTLLSDNELDALGLPAHPGERHSPALALPETLSTEALWLGG
jgi:hypothetical protein